MVASGYCGVDKPVVALFRRYGPFCLGALKGRQGIQTWRNYSP